MCKVIAICNQKGGVSKTTTTVNLGVGMVREGKRVLVIDADPQGNLSQSLGIENPDELEIAQPLWSRLSWTRSLRCQRELFIMWKELTSCLVTLIYPVWMFLWLMQ